MRSYSWPVLCVFLWAMAQSHAAPAGKTGLSVERYKKNAGP